MRCFAACSIAAIGLSASWSVGCKAPAPDASASASAAATEVLPQFDEDMIPSVDVPRLEADVEGTIKIDGVLDEASADALDAQVATEMKQALAFARAGAEPDISTVFDHLYACPAGASPELR